MHVGSVLEEGFLSLPREHEVFAAPFPTRVAEFWEGCLVPLVCQVRIALDLVQVSFFLS